MCVLHTSVHQRNQETIRTSVTQVWNWKNWTARANFRFSSISSRWFWLSVFSLQTHVAFWDSFYCFWFSILQRRECLNFGGGSKRNRFLVFRDRIFAVCVCFGFSVVWVCLWCDKSSGRIVVLSRECEFSKNISLTRPYIVVWFILQLLIFLSKNYKNLFATLCFFILC